MPRRYRRKYRKYKKTTKAVAYKALKLAKKANSAIEMKFIDTPIAITNVNWDGTPLAQLNDSLQGLADNEHIGDEIRVSSLRWRGQFSSNSSRIQHFRCIIFYDKYNTISSPSDILESTGSVQSVVSDYTIDKRSDYIILYDSIINTDGVKAFSGFRKGRKKINKKTKFDGGTSTIEKGIIKHFCISDLDPAATPQAQYQMYFRCYYMDA